MSSIQFIHAHSHNGIWLNEIADSLLSLHRNAFKSDFLRPSRPYRLPRYPEATKAECKRMLSSDENDFWANLVRPHGSVSGHVKWALGLDRDKIKLTFRNLIGDKTVQHAFVCLLTAQMFKVAIRGKIYALVCRFCTRGLGTWAHVFHCAGLADLPIGFLRSPEGLAVIARAFAAQERVILPSCWAPPKWVVSE